MSTTDVRDNVRETVEEALKVTPSVYVLARAAKIKAEDLAAAFVDEEKNEDYVADFASALVKARRAADKAENAKKTA